MIQDCSVNLTNVCLDYDLYRDKTHNLKEALINLVSTSRKTPSGVEKLHALKNINLELKSGDRIGIVGLNGAGKSTLLKVISGILKPTAGAVQVHGNMQPLIEVGAGFHPEFSGRENIYFNGYMLGFNKKQIREKELEIIEFSELEEFIDVPVKYYSSGMQTRLAFSIATSIEPEILVFDEMLSAGDITFVDKAKRRMADLIEKARILILVSHDLSLVQSITTQAILLEKGEMVFRDSSENVIEEYQRRSRPS